MLILIEDNMFHSPQCSIILVQLKEIEFDMKSHSRFERLLLSCTFRNLPFNFNILATAVSSPLFQMASRLLPTSIWSGFASIGVDLITCQQSGFASPIHSTRANEGGGAIEC